jgi:pilus assembly protein CpaF
MDLKTRIGRMEGQAAVAQPVEISPAAPAPSSAPAAAQSAAQKEREMKTRVHQKLLTVADLSLLTSMEERSARAQIREITHRLMEEDGLPLNTIGRQRIVKEIEDEVLGLGPLEPLLDDPTVSDILINGCNSVFVERKGRLQHTDVHFQSDAHLMNIIDRIVSRVGRRSDESCPMVDARLKDGSRVNAIIPPLALDGPVVSIRRFGADPLRMDDLIRLHAFTPAIGRVLQGIARAQINVLISGGTGSGKTTLLNVLSGFIPDAERIITIEDSAELQLQQTHVVRLETRPANVEGKGEITQRDLVKNALRMRPDRIVVGEVRGQEALDMLQAMNTGHDGSLTTIHANTPRDALIRLENMVAMAGLELPVRALRAQVASAINIVVQVERLEDGRRRMVSLQEINGMEGDIITMSEIFRFVRTGVDEEGNVKGYFTATGIIPKFQERLQTRGIAVDMSVYDPGRMDDWEEDE